MLDPAVREILLELARRRPAVVDSQRDEAAEMAASLRAFYYPKQRAYFTSKAKLRATKKTRRAGATTGGCREFIARAIEHPGWRGTYVTTTRKEARERAWTSDTKSGLLDILREYGVHVDHPSIEVRLLGGVRADIRDQATGALFDDLIARSTSATAAASTSSALTTSGPCASSAASRSTSTGSTRRRTSASSSASTMP